MKSALVADPLALLDEHLPELGARPSLPHDRPQRRDQHGARQRQLDARARVAARLRALRRRPREGAAGRARRAARTRRTSTTCSSCSCSPGRSLPHAMMMMIPEAYDGRDDLPEELRGFYAFHGCLTEPWDGPASISFTDGTVIGATLDRNGLRPGRWMETKDGWVVLASETGVLDEPPENVLRKGRLQPGKLFLVDLEQRPDRRGRRDQARDRERAALRRVVPRRRSCTSPTCPSARRACRASSRCAPRQLAFGYTQEDMKVILTPLARNAEEPIGSMGNDLALAVLSDQRPLLYSYFKQLFAQVTNPPIDSTREAVVMSVAHERRLGAQPARRDARARAPARDRPADPARHASSRALRQVDSDDLQGAHDRHHLAGRRGHRRARRRARADLRARPTRRSPTASTS